MSGFVTEDFDSRRGIVGQGASYVLRLTVHDTDDDAEVETLIEGFLPAFYAGKILQTYEYERDGVSTWKAEARYGERTPLGSGESSFSFDTGGGTQNIKATLQTVGAYPTGSTPQTHGLIGNNGREATGCDIVVPVYNFTETHYLSDSIVDETYKAALFSLTGRVNGGSWKGFSAGEVLFLGASGSKRGYEDWEINFRFAASPNLTDLTVGDIENIAKGGWQYLWIRYADEVDSDKSRLVQKPIAVYVERVYQDGDFSTMGIGT